MKTLFKSLQIIMLLFFSFGCTSKQSDQLTQQQKDQIKKEVMAVGDSIIARLTKLDVRWFDYYMDSPDWGMVNADGTRWDYQTTKKVLPDLYNSVTSWQWTTTRQDFIFVTKEFVICAWDGKDETVMKSGDKITYNPHAYTMVFKKIAGQWKVIYSHDSGVPVAQTVGQK